MEQGTSVVWAYRKWNSGILEQWARQGWTLDRNVNWLGFYITQEIVISNYVIPFVEAPMSIIQADTEANGWIMTSNTSSSTTKPSNIYFIGPEPQTGRSYVVSMYAKGKWK